PHVRQFDPETKGVIFYCYTQHPKRYPLNPMPYLIIHGHFYQPPRENPWTGIVEAEPSAAPFHDWNERIHFECYRANAFVRLGDAGPDEQFVNNYAHVSFNFGPTLLNWLERYHPYTYARILEA